MKKGAKAVFLDRDGTLNIDPGYIQDPAQVQLISGVGSALKKLKSAGFLLVVVSNQSGIGRGLIDPLVLPKIHRRFNDILAKDGIQIDHFEHCPHLPDDRCACRKPMPGMIEKVCEKLGIIAAESFMVGDRLKDLECGRRSGCAGVALVRTGCGEREEKSGEFSSLQIDYVADDLDQVAEWIISQV